MCSYITLIDNFLPKKKIRKENLNQVVNEVQFHIVDVVFCLMDKNKIIEIK